MIDLKIRLFTFSTTDSALIILSVSKYIITKCTNTPVCTGMVGGPVSSYPKTTSGITGLSHHSECF